MDEPQTFTCRAPDCGKTSGVTDNDHIHGVYYIACEHCHAKHAVEDVPVPAGMGGRWRIIGVMTGGAEHDAMPTG